MKKRIIVALGLVAASLVAIPSVGLCYGYGYRSHGGDVALGFLGGTVLGLGIASAAAPYYPPTYGPGYAPAYSSSYYDPYYRSAPRVRTCQERVPVYDRYGYAHEEVRTYRCD